MPTKLNDEVLWICPSLDDVGNGTTTANNLAGGAVGNGTFAGSLASGDWTADTDEGGVRLAHAWFGSGYDGSA